MKKIIVRNIAIVSAIFIIAFSIMLVTNYFRINAETPLQAEVLETLKEINDQNASNTALQEQIRELDLLARKAYFINAQQLKLGLTILVAILIVFVVSIRIYLTDIKHIPEKEITPIDDWANKSSARKYIIWGVGGLTAIALVFGIFSMPFLKSNKDAKEASQIAENAQDLLENSEEQSDNTLVASDSTVNTADGSSTAADSTKSEAIIEISKVTHNGFRGNNSNGISQAKNLPTSWNLASGKNILWKVPIPRKGYNSPVINGNKVFFSGADQAARELFCYELSSGKKLWSVQANNIPGSPASPPTTTDDTGLAASTVATNGVKVCAIFATGDIICADTSGTRHWAKNLGVPDNHYGYASSLLIYGSTVYIQYDNANSPRITALNLETGAQRWSVARKEKVTWSSPIIAWVEGKAQLILMGNPAITAYNPSNGAQIWRVEGFSGEVGASACSSNGLIFGASEYAKLFAINGADGTVLWESDEVLPEVSSPVANKENVFVATSYGTIACFDTQTGEMRKSHELGGEFYSSPIIAAGRVYIFSNEGKMFIFSANASFSLVNSFATGEKTFATPAFTDGKIVVRTEKSIYCVAIN